MPFNGLSYQFSGSTPNIFASEPKSGDRLWIPDHVVGRFVTKQTNIHGHENWQFNADRGVSRTLSRFGSNPSRAIRSNQEGNLYRANASEQAGKYAQDRIIPRPIPDYRKPLPKGFGYLTLFGFFCGVLLCCWILGGIALWDQKWEGNENPKRKGDKSANRNGTF